MQPYLAALLLLLATLIKVGTTEVSPIFPRARAALSRAASE